MEGHSCREVAHDGQGEGPCGWEGARGVQVGVHVRVGVHVQVGVRTAHDALN